MNIAVVTYPRSGSTYLSWLLSFSFGKKIDKFHLENNQEVLKLNNYDYSIATVRNPVDSITSIVTMESLYFRNGKDFDIYVQERIKARIEEYVFFYNVTLNRISTFVDYDVINSKRELLVEYVSNKTNNIIINKEYVDLVKDRPDNNFLRSSKVDQNYETIKQLVLNEDLSECFIAYNKSKMQIVDL